MNTEDHSYLVFRMDHLRYGVCVLLVEKVLMAVELIRLPDAPSSLSGLLNLKGRILPVINLRKLSRMPEKEISAKDRIVICRIHDKKVAFIADQVEGVVDFEKNDLKDSGSIHPEIPGHGVEGIGKTKDDAVILYDIETLFSHLIPQGG